MMAFVFGLELGFHQVDEGAEEHPRCGGNMEALKGALMVCLELRTVLGDCSPVTLQEGLHAS